MNKHLRRINPSGLVVSGPGMTGPLEGPIEVLFAGVVGGMAGFIFGMLCGVLARVFTVNRVKGIIGGRHWAAWGAGAGGLALAMMELFD
ncbi:MAG TPA: hypothetical protein VGF13_10430 [Verrucomicrobiae bacterium]|jgi:hypothetical protein